MSNPNHPISPGYAPNPDADLTTPIRRDAGHTIRLNPDGYRIPDAPPAVVHPEPPHPVNLVASHRSPRRPHRPRRRHIIDAAWWQVTIGLAATHAVAALLGALTVAALITDWTPK